MLDFQAARYLMAGEVRGAGGQQSSDRSANWRFPHQDGYVNIAPTPVMWRRFCKAIAREDLIEHERYATPKSRRENRDALNALIGEITATMTTDALIERLNDGGIPCGPDLYDRFRPSADPQVQHLGRRPGCAIIRVGNDQARGPAVHAQPHAEPDGERGTRIWRANRRDPQRDRLLAAGDRGSSGRQVRSTT
jgi:hypothetical protein